MMNHRNRSVSYQQFAMVPNAQIPRSSYRMASTYKTTFNAGDLVPIFVEEVLPGDSFSVGVTAFARLATPLFPTMDNLHFESFWFFVPNRLAWTQWPNFMGESEFAGAPVIDYFVPQIPSPVGGWPIGSLGDYFGLPTVGQVAALGFVNCSALPFRGYNLIYNEWFRDQNLIENVAVDPTSNGPDTAITTNTAVLKRAKYHDYFTSCLPFLQKGDPVSIPIATQAPVITNNEFPLFTATGAVDARLHNTISAGAAFSAATGSSLPVVFGTESGLVADLSAATSATINNIRLAFQIQKLLERDARGGSRYTELIHSHFGVMSPDARLQRPEYLGGGSNYIMINPVAQTSATAVEGSDTPQGNLAAVGTSLHQSGFTSSFTEHGYLFCLINVRADLTYQQGKRRHWSRQTRYDYYWPAFAQLGEQAVLSQEIFCDGEGGDNFSTFGFQERWAEYRYLPNQITGLFRSTAAQTIDPWHYAERFVARPSLNAAFITDPTEDTLARTLAVGEAAGGQQLILDAAFNVKVARPLPLFSQPGNVDHF